MSHVVKTENSITLSGALTRALVTQLRGDLLEVVSPQTREVSLSDVDAIDSAGVQLVCALLKGFPQLRVTDVSPAVRTVLTKLGVPGLFGGV